jgi:chromosome segregation ATPase
MSTNIFKVTTATLAIALAASAFWGFTERKTKNNLQSSFDKELLKNEALVSEKLTIQKERDKSNQSAKEANLRSADLAYQIETINKKLKENAEALSRAKTENSNSRKKYNELLDVRQKLESELASLKTNQSTLEDESKTLTGQLASLKGENEKLREDLRATQLSQFDKPLVEATRGSNHKLVAKASRVQNLRTTLAINANAKELKFGVINPRGTSLTEKEGTVESRVLSSTSSYQLIEIVFTPKKKLLPGLYQVEVVSGGTHVASLQVRLR